MPKVSVIIPVYNTEKYLKRCLDSVCDQTLSDIEIICINDASTDKSLEILQEYSAKDERIKIIDFKENKGAAVARNTGIDAADGEYIGFVDSDDYIDLDFYEKLYDKAKETNADAVKGKMRCINSDKETGYDKNNLIKKNFAYFYDSFTTAIYNKFFIKNNNILFPENVNYFEDPYFSILAGLKYKKVSVVDSANYYYVNRLNSLVNSTGEEHLISGVEAMFILSKKINEAEINKEHYSIIYSYVISQLVAVLYNIKCGQNVINKSNEYLLDMFLSCKYKSECITNYFEAKRYIQKKYYANKIRNKMQRGK